MNAITKPSGPNAAQWLAIEKANGRPMVIRGNASKELMREAARELVRLAGEEETSDAQP